MMRCVLRPLLIVITLALWVVAGPVGMAFDGCAMMSAMCEAPCGVLPYIVAPVAPVLAVRSPLAYLESSFDDQPTVLASDPLHRRPSPHSSPRSVLTFVSLSR